MDSQGHQSAVAACGKQPIVNGKAGEHIRWCEQLSNLTAAC